MKFKLQKGKKNLSFELKDNHEPSSIHSDAEFPVMQSSDIKREFLRCLKREHRKLIIIAAIIIIYCNHLFTIYLATSGKEPTPKPKQEIASKPMLTIAYARQSF